MRLAEILFAGVVTASLEPANQGAVICNHRLNGEFGDWETAAPCIWDSGLETRWAHRLGSLCSTSALPPYYVLSNLQPAYAEKHPINGTRQARPSINEKSPRLTASVPAGLAAMVPEEDLAREQDGAPEAPVSARAADSAADLLA